MTTQEVRDYINTILNKDSSGNSLSPDEFNLLMKANIYSFVKDQILQHRQFIASGNIDNVVFTSLLVDALYTSTTASLSGGSFTLPTDMLFLSDLYGTYNANQKKIELVSPEEYSQRVSNLLSKPIAYHPVAYIEGTACKVNPQNMTAIKVLYIKSPTIPVFDYYNDANDNIVYLAAAATHYLTSGETGSAGQSSVTVTSLTVELTSIPTELHVKFGDFLISKAMMRDKNVQGYQLNENEISK